MKLILSPSSAVFLCAAPITVGVNLTCIRSKLVKKHSSMREAISKIFSKGAWAGAERNGDVAVSLCWGYRSLFVFCVLVFFFPHRLEDLHEAELAAGTQRKTTRVKAISGGRVKISKLQIAGESSSARQQKHVAAYLHLHLLGSNPNVGERAGLLAELFRKVERAPELRGGRVSSKKKKKLLRM